MTKLMQGILSEVAQLPEAEQDIYAGLMLTHFIRTKERTLAQGFSARLWARLNNDDPEYVRDHDARQKQKAEKADHFIGLVLLVDWDPVGVFGNPATEREYTRYVPGVRDLLFSFPSVEVVADHLYTIEREQMELGRKHPERQAARRAVLRQVAQKLVSLSDEWKLKATAERLSA